MVKWATVALELVGLALIVYGLGSIWAPLAAIAGGLALIGVAIMVDNEAEEPTV